MFTGLPCSLSLRQTTLNDFAFVLVIQFMLDPVEDPRNRRCPISHLLLIHFICEHIVDGIPLDVHIS